MKNHSQVTLYKLTVGGCDLGRVRFHEERVICPWAVVAGVLWRCALSKLGRGGIDLGPTELTSVAEPCSLCMGNNSTCSTVLLRPQ